jgi:hypothetical protein
MAASNDRSAKDKQMAARLKAEGDDRHIGRCCICYRIISNGAACENHYGAHARGASD